MDNANLARGGDLRAMQSTWTRRSELNEALRAHPTGNFNKLTNFSTVSCALKNYPRGFQGVMAGLGVLQGLNTNSIRGADNS